VAGTWMVRWLRPTRCPVEVKTGADYEGLDFIRNQYRITVAVRTGASTCRCRDRAGAETFSSRLPGAALL
jgi:hypothetical protein